MFHSQNARAGPHQSQAPSHQISGTQHLSTPKSALAESWIGRSLLYMALCYEMQAANLLWQMPTLIHNTILILPFTLT